MANLAQTDGDPYKELERPQGSRFQDKTSDNFRSISNSLRSLPKKVNLIRQTSIPFDLLFIRLSNREVEELVDPLRFFILTIVTLIVLLQSWFVILEEDFFYALIFVGFTRKIEPPKKENMCNICQGRGFYEFSYHKNGYFIIDIFTCFCQGSHHLIRRKFIKQPSPWPIAATIAGLFVFCLIMV